MLQPDDVPLLVDGRRRARGGHGRDPDHLTRRAGLTMRSAASRAARVAKHAGVLVILGDSTLEIYTHVYTLQSGVVRSANV